jgi:hypothetical protein
MKAIAIFANVVLLLLIGGTFLFAMLESGGSDLEDILVAVLLGAFPVVNILALRKTPGDWLSLYLRRKAAEERQRIEALEGHRGSRESA